MQLQQEILREQMETIRIEIQKIMKDISMAMKEEARQAQGGIGEPARGNRSNQQWNTRNF